MFFNHKYFSRRALGLGLLVGIGLTGAAGCGLIGPGKTTAVIQVSVNGQDVTAACPAIERGGLIYLPFLAVIEQMGGVAAEVEAAAAGWSESGWPGAIRGNTNQPNTNQSGPGWSGPGRGVLAIRADGTPIAYRWGALTARVGDGEAVLGAASIIDKAGTGYAPLSLIETVLEAKAAGDAGHVRLTGPGSGSDGMGPSPAKAYVKALASVRNAPFFEADRLLRYAAYIERNPELPAAAALVRVNINLDKEFYTGVEVVSAPEDLLVLCNKYNQLPSDYVPPDLAELPGGHFLRAPAAEAYQKMADAAAAEELTFHLRSTYRSYESQAELYDGYSARESQAAADMYSARPGHSEHQTGLAFDVTQPVTGGNLTAAAFQNTEQYAWLREHAHEFGFILRYPEDKTKITGYIYEPWHYRYVGPETAAVIHGEGLTLDEYWGKYKTP